MKILVTDDSKIARKMVVKTLNEVFVNKNIEIYEASNGKEALEIFSKNQPAITFLDLTMPVMDGFETLKEIKEINNDAKVVIISADIQKSSIDKAIQLGAENFIKKPIDSSKMKLIIDKI